MLQVGKDFLHYTISGMPQIGKGKLSRKLTELTGRPIVSIDSLIEDFTGMDIGSYLSFLQQNGFSKEDTWLMFKDLGSKIISTTLYDYIYIPAIFDLGGSDLVPQISDIRSHYGRELAKKFSLANFEILKQNSIIICAHPYKSKKASVNFFLKGLDRVKWKSSRPPQGDFLSPSEDLAYRASNRHRDYKNNSHVTYYTKGKQASKGHRPMEILELFQKLERERLELVA